MKRILILITGLLLAPGLALAAPPQAELLTQRLTELLPRDALWGVTVLNLKSGREILATGNAHELLAPASLVKLITAGAALAHYLAAASRQPWFQDLRDSLPRPGLDGTLRNGTYRNERFHAKSGSLENVIALAGYGVDKAGREIAFAFIANTPGPLPPTAGRAGDELMRYLAE